MEPFVSVEATELGRDTAQEPFLSLVATEQAQGPHGFLVAMALVP